MYNFNFSSNCFRGCWIDWHILPWPTKKKHMLLWRAICMNVGNGFRMNLNTWRTTHSSFRNFFNSLIIDVVEKCFAFVSNFNRMENKAILLDTLHMNSGYRFVFGSRLVCAVFRFRWCAWLKVSTSSPQRILLFFGKINSHKWCVFVWK